MIDNRPGAGGMVAMQQVKNAAKDGHTLAVVTNAHMVWNPYVFPKLTYDPATDLVAVSPISVIPMALVVNPKVPAQTTAELFALGRAEGERWLRAHAADVGLRPTINLADIP